MVVYRYVYRYVYLHGLMDPHISPCSVNREDQE